MADNNFNISGDEARILMAALRTSNLAAPMGALLGLYQRLSVIAQVQPPSQPAQETSNEDN